MRQVIFIFVFVIAALGIGFFAYWFFIGDSNLDSSGYTIEREKKLAEYRKIKTLRLDASMFSDPFLRSLTSPTSSEPAVVRDPSQRANPFLSR